MSDHYPSDYSPHLFEMQTATVRSLGVPRALHTPDQPRQPEASGCLAHPMRCVSNVQESHSVSPEDCSKDSSCEIGMAVVSHETANS